MTGNPAEVLSQASALGVAVATSQGLMGFQAKGGFSSAESRFARPSVEATGPPHRGPKAKGYGTCETSPRGRLCPGFFSLYYRTTVSGRR